MLTSSILTKVWLKGQDFEKEFLNAMETLYPYMTSHSAKAVKEFEAYLDEHLTLSETDNRIHTVSGRVDIEDAEKNSSVYWNTVSKEFEVLIKSKIRLESQPDIDKVNMILIGTRFPAKCSRRDEIENAMAGVFLHRVENPPQVYVVRDRKCMTGEYFIAFIQ